MKTCKIAITIPTDILKSIDMIATKLKISRSKLIATGAKNIAKEYKQKAIAQVYDEVFMDPDIAAEQIQMSEEFLHIASVNNETR
jgi:metal-responsive CopG/Arc/MetJ family transcriptional regulator